LDCWNIIASPPHIEQCKTPQSIVFDAINRILLCVRATYTLRFIFFFPPCSDRESLLWETGCSCIFRFIRCFGAQRPILRVLRFILWNTSYLLLYYCDTRATLNTVLYTENNKEKGSFHVADIQSLVINQSHFKSDLDDW